MLKRARHFLSIALCLSMVTSCLQDPGSGSRRGVGQNAEGSESDRDSNGGNGSGSGPTDGTLGGDSGITLGPGRAELRFIVDPFTGTYKNKVTLPKNFTGELYIAGLNITSLNDRLVSVRFNFGREIEPVEIPATITRGSGITPQTDIEVLALSMDDRPFQEIRLLYDLFDYNDYRDEDGNETLDPITNPRDGNLYCRGLRLEHDPTFQSSSNNTRCDGFDGEGNPINERCLYSYAKIVDAGLFNPNQNLFKVPTEPQIDLNGTNGMGYVGDSAELQLSKCLPDTNDRTTIEGVLNAQFLLSGSGVFGNDLDVPGAFTQYRGPFRSIGINSWEIRANALITPVTSSQAGTGLFQATYDGTALTGYRSFLFPRAGRMELQAGVEHFSSQAPFGLKSLNSRLTSGPTDFMDGCNLRVSNYDAHRNEGLSSCNVTATIEIVSRSQLTGQTEVLASSKDLKLQLIRPSITNFRGEEVLYSSMKTCSSSSACGSSECCFNNRCWSKELVSQCLEDVPVVGNRGIGQVCGSDFECSSLCCNQSTGTCAVHINTDTEQKLCSKAPGQACVSREYCRREFLSECFVVRTGTNIQGGETCALRCYSVPKFGDCRNGICIPPLPRPIPQFDPSNPDCSEAIDPPTF
jgi:hypothetical protein